MIPLNQFFENLEDRRCHTCGEVLMEQADCYECTCEKCSPFAVNTAFPMINQTVKA